MYFASKWLVVAGLLLLIKSCVCAPTTRAPGVPCKPCPKGYGVEEGCTETQDTYCIPCPHGTYSHALSPTEKCNPCSRCGEHLYELHSCNATNDVFCELCEWLAVPENEDYQKKCIKQEDVVGGDGSGTDNEIIAEPEKSKDKDAANREEGPHETAASDKTQQESEHGAQDNVPPETSTSGVNGTSTVHGPYVPTTGIALTIFVVGSVFFGIGFVFSSRTGHAKKKVPMAKQGYEKMAIMQEKKEIYTGTPPTFERQLSMFNEEDEIDESVPLTMEPTTGRFQSPVDIDPEEADVDVILEKHPLEYKYVQEKTRYITNTGHTVRVDMDGQPSKLEGGPLGDTVFCLDHYHFHWGASNERGSEHTIKGQRYAAELHMVHWNNHRYSTFEEASKSENGLAVLAVLIEVGGKEHPIMKCLTDLLPEIRYKNSRFEIPGTGFDPTLRLPENKHDYWTYMGSLTTPPYYETVTWVVFKEPIQITEQQMDNFRNILTIEPGEEHLLDGDGDNGRLVDNFRTTLPLEDRAIKASFC